MERIVVGLLALVGVGFVAFAGFQSVTWLAPSIAAVESAASAEHDPLREMDETQEVVDENENDNEPQDPQ